MDEPAAPHPKVFCSHRSLDKPMGEPFVRRLDADGIDVWYDDDQMGPGDLVIAKLDEGLASCDIGLVFLSSNAETGPYLAGGARCATDNANRGPQTPHSDRPGRCGEAVHPPTPATTDAGGSL